MQKVSQPTQVYDISIGFPHVFFITEAEILTHNYVAPFIQLAWRFGGGLAFKGLTLGANILGAYLTSKFAKDASKVKISVMPGAGGGDTGGPGYPDDNDKNKGRKKEANELAKKMKFKRTKEHRFDSHGEKVFKKGGRYISLDRNAHKGGFWKVFDRNMKRLGTYNRDLSIKISD